MEFIPYPKTPRLRRDIVITEKIDGTNAQVHIRKIDNAYDGVDDFDRLVSTLNDDGTTSACAVRAGSRNRWIKPGKDTDNYGFAGWVWGNAIELANQLGEGQHFGEWWGQGIARGYGIGEKRFSLFNTARWGSHNPNTPACCHVVPVIAVGSLLGVDDVLQMLRDQGSVAAPGFMSPEGIIVYHTASKQPYKVLLENDELPKGLVKA